MSDYIMLFDRDGQPYISHHGVLGQKWGIRRYQNKDGTRTAAGKKRYRAASKKMIKTNIVLIKKAIIKWLKQEFGDQNLNARMNSDYFMNVSRQEANRILESHMHDSLAAVDNHMFMMDMMNPF